MGHFGGPIGLFDSGFGGLTVLRRVREALPEEDYIYLGDTARTPYGSRSEETIIRYTEECFAFLRSLDIRLLVVACNTASAFALPHLVRHADIPVIGTVRPAVRTALARSRTRRLIVIGTEGTIRSGAYDAALREADPNVEVHSVPCPLFVPLVEQGMVRGEIVDKVVEWYLAPVRGKGDVVILGCTHYPLLFDAIAAYLGPEVHIVDCAGAIAEEVRTRATSRAGAVGRQGSVRYFVTDDPERFNRLGGLFLGDDGVRATKVESLTEGPVTEPD